MKATWFLLPALALCAIARMPAQTQTGSAAIPSIDGNISQGEYRITGSFGGMNLGLTLSDDGTTLYVALMVPSSGWASVGLGSKKMNGAFIVIGADTDGTTIISEETGKGHGHSPNATNILIAQAIKESTGKTVLEFAIPSKGFIKDGRIDLILAYGAQDLLKSRHKKYEKVSFTL